MTPQPRPLPNDPDADVSSPYGPQPYGTDSSAGGADSSPFETEPSEDRKAAADDGTVEGEGEQSK